MDRSAPSNDATPVRRPATPLQPTTAVRLLSTEVDHTDTVATPHTPKLTPTHLIAPPPLAHLTDTTTSRQHHSPSAKMPRRIAKAVERNAAVPALAVESLNISITSGTPSPLSEWSNKTQKHPRPSDTQLQQMRRLLSTTADSDDCPPEDVTGLSTPLPEHSQVRAVVVCSPTACSGSAKGTPSGDETLQQEHTSASTPVLGVSHSSRVSQNLDEAFVEVASALAVAAAVDTTVTGVEEPASPSLGTPANVSRTPEKAADGPDLSPCTVSSMTVGDTVTPTLPQYRGSVWLCDVSREEEDDHEHDRKHGDGPADMPQRSRCLFSTDATVGDADQEDREVPSDGLASPDDDVRRSLFSHDKRMYVFSCSPVTPFSPVHRLGSPLDGDFALPYPLFQPHVLSPYQRGLQVSITQVTPSNTDLLTNVFVESATEPMLPQFGGRPQPTGDHNNTLVATQELPDRQSPLHPCTHTPPQLFTADASMQLCHAMTASLSSHSCGRPSPSSGDADMGTQVFCGGAQLISPILQRHHIAPSRVTFVGEGSSATPHKFAHEHPRDSVRTSNTPTNRLREAPTHDSPDNAFADAFASLRGQPGNAGHSSPHTPRDVSAVAGRAESGCGSVSVPSTPLLPSFDGGSLEVRSLSVSGAAAHLAGIAELVQRADTPKSPHTPPHRRTPGPAGLHGGSYTSLSEGSYGVPSHRPHHRPPPSQPLTPQKSARRSFSRQTTPSQSFRSKVQSHSFESQQQQQQPQLLHSHPSGLWAARGPANTSNASGVFGDATVTAQRDYLAPSRNPFSLYRSFELYTNPMFKPESFLHNAEQKCMDDSTNSDASTHVISADPPLTEKERQFVKELATATLRPDAAVVLYEQLIPAPAHAPGSHRPRTKASTPSQASFDLLLHAPRSRHPVSGLGSAALTLSGCEGLCGQGRGGSGAAGVPGVTTDHRNNEEEEGKRGEEGATVHSSAAAPTTIRTTPHQDVGLRGSNTNSLRPQVTLASCSPRRAVTEVEAVAAIVSSSSLFTPSRDLGEAQAATCAVDTPIGMRVPAPGHQPGDDSPYSTFATSTSSTLFCGAHDHDTPNCSASTTASSAAAAARHVFHNTVSPNRKDGHDPLSATEDGDVDEDAADSSPPPRRPTSKFDYGDDDDGEQSSLCTDSRLCAERQLQFGAEDAEDEEERSGGDSATANGSGDAATASAEQAPPLVVHSPLTLAYKEVSTCTESSTGSPNFLRSTVANINPFLEKLSTPPLPHVPDALHTRASEDHPVTAMLLPPSSAASQVPTEKHFDLLKSPVRPPSHQEPHHPPPPPPPQRLYTPAQDTPGLRRSMESTSAQGTGGMAQRAPRALSVDLACDGNDVASVLSLSAYQGPDPALDPMEATDVSEEETPGDRFQAHHEFQFLHYIEAALESPVEASYGTPGTSRSGAAGRPIPLCVEVNGVTWLATHRLNGLPYAVKEVPAVAFNVAELRCLTLSNSGHHSLHEKTRLASAHVITPGDVLEAEDYLARYYSVSTPPQDSSRPAVHLLQLEYFPRGSVHDLVYEAGRRLSARNGVPASLSNSMRRIAPVAFHVDFWEPVVQQGLRGLRALHHAGLVHGCPLPCCLFFAGHISTQLRVKWSCFGSARANADVYPTESLPPWMSEAVSLLYKQYEGDGTLSVAVIEVAVFCLGVLELLVEDAQVRDGGSGLPAPPHATRNDGLSHLEWMEEIAQHRHHDPNDVYTAEEAQLQGFMRFLWNTANVYLTADEVLSQMGVRIDPALRTAEDLYQYEIDRLCRQLRERKQQSKRRQWASTISSPPHSHHERVPSTLSQVSVELPPALQPHKEESRSSTSGASGGVYLLPCFPRVADGHELARTMPGVPVLDAPQSFSGLRKSPHMFPRRTSAPCIPLPRTAFLDSSGERQHPSLGAPGSGVFLPPSMACTRPAVASISMLPLKFDRPASDVSARRLKGRRGRSDVHPRVREAARAMLMKALFPPQWSEDSLTPSSVWKTMLAPVVYALRLRGWVSLYAGLPLAVTGAGKTEGRTEEETLQALLTSLWPMTSFE
ncbi:hypothetical protein ABB37_09503 [Leptomonas pyrrhocoris]|uniref:Protein kinase domain-containing protein n=1 Tax=Leptomonas pyrrhocoris TaxID=157538 RepID=A0A0M9FQN3_LEPPY|nr:hypothetical protein ABB37_09503 [Leptomonas pyrrhocoris]KPA73886.1 hypothetical protein ABB37_09503 [Leptomonas pyrrhocoris]|eukprot:XP_015652325.1 hypothetical protein ABB37_09503 [Leptomonas pyrrhocoris]